MASGTLRLVGGPNIVAESIVSRKEALTKLRDVLLLRREALRKALDGDLSMLQALSQDGGDVIDVAMDTAQDEISSQLIEVESRELSQIEEALTRLRDGHYGNCDHCDKPIPLARLQAVPYAVSCRECARKQEKYSPRFATGLGDSSQASNASL
ncbi:MAG TPA: TraR/DksA family transcriptional regulator [Pirellula sp.]|nr:TraR/DksA family transcriptional regulator [Pirellula sp.]